MVSIAKKRVSKRKKSSWRKHIDTTDVDEFLEDKRREERIGSLDDKKDEEIFIIDTAPNNPSKSQRKHSFDDLKCFQILKPTSAVPDPVAKRNRVKSKEERKHPIRKKIEQYKRASGSISKKLLKAQNQRSLALKTRKQKPKGVEFHKDIWTADGKDENKGMDWLDVNTVRHTKANTNDVEVRVPVSVITKKSVLPSIEIPHPGMSYNPTYKDHQALLREVAEKEIKIEKEEAHFTRATTAMFRKVTPKEKEESWLAEMSHCLAKEEEEITLEQVEYSNEYKAINPPTSFERKKTLKQKRKQREQKLLQLEKRDLKVEKKKVSDIYKLKFLTKSIEDKERKLLLIKGNKQKKEATKRIEPRRLGKLKFSEPDLNFTPSSNLKGNLRASKPEGSLLADRFYSLQRRNILCPSMKVTKFRKSKVKSFVKDSHRTKS